MLRQEWQEFRDYVTSRGVDFDTLSNEEKRLWSETFDKSKQHTTTVITPAAGNAGLVADIAAAIVQVLPAALTMNADIFARSITKIMKEDSLLRKHASNLTLHWYQNVLRFRCDPLPSNQDGVHEFKTNFSETMHNFLVTLSEASSPDEKHVQAACEPLWEKIKVLFFPDGECRVDNKKRHISTNFDDILDNDDGTLKRCTVTGVPDGTIVWIDQGIHIWELKGQSYSLDGMSADSLVGCAQIAVYMKADIESMWEHYKYLPETSMGLLTNGKTWILITAEASLESGIVHIHWSRTVPSYFDLHSNKYDELAVLNLIYLACQFSIINLEHLKKASLTQQMKRLSVLGDQNHDGSGGGKDFSQHYHKGNDHKKGSGGGGNKKGGGGGNQKGSGSGHLKGGNIEKGGSKGGNGDVLDERGGGGKGSGREKDAAWRNSGKGQPLTSLPLTIENIQKISPSNREPNAFQSIPIVKAFLKRKTMVFSVTADELFEM